MKPSTSLGSIVRARRLELGLTQEQLAERISDEEGYIRQSEISRIESGRVALPRRERLERLAAALDLSLGELLARSGWTDAQTYFTEQPGRASPPAPNADDAILLEPARRHAMLDGRYTGDPTGGRAAPRVAQLSTTSLHDAIESLHREARRLGRGLRITLEIDGQVWSLAETEHIQTR
jgi:transcriptional regulator with XRE-family HTH domain